MTDRLFNRNFVLQVGSTRIAARSEDNPDVSKPTLRVNFKVEKSLDPKPNTVAVVIYNLSAQHRNALQKKLPIIIEAGYTNTMQQLFSGDITRVTQKREGTDWLSTVESGDGINKYASKRINVSMGPNTSTQAVLSKLVGAFELSKGNSAQKLIASNFPNNYKVFEKGLVLSGKVSDIFSTYCNSAGFTWSIQDGEFQILKLNETTKESAILLNKNTGLIGSPEIGEDSTIQATSLLQGTIKPGRLIKVESSIVTGSFKVVNVIHSGDTHGNEWYSTFEAKAL